MYISSKVKTFVNVHLNIYMHIVPHISVGLLPLNNNNAEEYDVLHGFQTVAHNKYISGVVKPSTSINVPAILVRPTG